MNATNKTLSTTHEMDDSDVQNLSLDHDNDKSMKNNKRQSSSIKSLLTRKYLSVSLSTSANVTTKQKKPRNSFRYFPHFLKRSHSTSTDVSIIPTTNNRQDQFVADSAHQNVQTRTSGEFDSMHKITSNTSGTCNTNSAVLVAISEEGNSVPMNQENRLDTINNHVDHVNLNQSDSGTSIHQCI